MVRAKSAVLPILATVLLSINVNDAKLSSNSYGLLSKIIGKNPSSPIVVVINNAAGTSGSSSMLRSPGDSQQGSSNVKHFDDSIDENKAVKYFGDILRSTGDENDPEVAQTNLKFQKALRSRCEALHQCKVKCKPHDPCKKKCKQDIDSFDMCNQKPKKDTCGSSNCWGKTLPPDWRF